MSTVKKTSKTVKNKPRKTPPIGFWQTLKKRLKQLLIGTAIALVVMIAGFLLPEKIVNPVVGATSSDWNKQSFWFYPWGRSGVHRGVDVFGKIGQSVVSATHGIVISTKVRALGGNTVTVLGPKWRLHYYAHLNKTDAHLGQWVKAGDGIGSVGTSGNAVGKTPHLHYSIRTLFPYFWQRDESYYGSQKMWYIDPTPRL